MEELVVNGESLSLRADGQLVDMRMWNIDVARAIAKRENLELTASHLEIINIMRDYYDQFNISPINKLLKKDIAAMLDANKASDEYLNTLFPHGVLSQGVRIAGLPTPHLDAELEPGKQIQSASATAQHFSTEFELNGKTYEVYPRGNLVHTELWNEDVAKHMASKESITLNDEHWEIINFLRGFYFKYGITPMVKLLIKHMRKHVSAEKCDEDYLYTLFPGGPARQGSRIAGLPEPQGCIDA